MVISKATLCGWIVTDVCASLQETHLVGVDFHEMQCLHYKHVYFELYFLIRM